MKSTTGRSSKKTARPDAHPAPGKTPGIVGAARGAEVAVQRLMHELEVHRVELEAQNVELRSSRDEAERVGARYAELFDSAPLGYVVLDVQGRIRDSNDHGARMLAVPRAWLEGTSFASYVAEENRPVVGRFIGAVLRAPKGANHGEVCEATLSVATGSIGVRLSAAALSGDEPRLLVAMLDVSEARRAARLLREEARRKDAFLAVLAHELRNPL
ncbi:MAG: PAS domain-containing protein, partial [Polyangiaceae bacterium]